MKKAQWPWLSGDLAKSKKRERSWYFSEDGLKLEKEPSVGRANPEGSVCPETDSDLENWRNTVLTAMPLLQCDQPVMGIHNHLVFFISVC